MEFKFIYTHEHCENTKTLQGVQTWMDLFTEFRDFLKGCGYMIPDGDISIEDLNAVSDWSAKEDISWRNRPEDLEAWLNDSNVSMDG